MTSAFRAVLLAAALTVAAPASPVNAIPQMIHPPWDMGPNFCRWNETQQQWTGWTASSIPCNVLMDGEPHK